MLCVATKILNLKAIPSPTPSTRTVPSAVRCNKNTKSESYSQFPSVYDSQAPAFTAVRCNKNTKSESYSQFLFKSGAEEWSCALQQKY